MPVPTRKMYMFQWKHRLPQTLERSPEGSEKGKAEGQKPAIICLSKSNCSEERKNKTALNPNTGKSKRTINFLFRSLYRQLQTRHMLLQLTTPSTIFAGTLLLGVWPASLSSPFRILGYSGTHKHERALPSYEEFM